MKTASVSKKFMKFAAAALIAGLLLSAHVAYAADEVAVTVRVEVCASEIEKTAMPKTFLSFGAEEGVFSALYALANLAGDELEYDTGEYGAYIVSLFGIADDGANSWMYSVNDEIPMVSSDQYELKNGDSVVFYYLSWQVGSYSYFDLSEASAEVGETVALTLNGVHFMEGLFPVAGAEVTVNGEPAGVTDESGKVELSFDEAGGYAVSATARDEDGLITISRPYCYVTIGEQAEGAEAEPEETDLDLEEADTAPEEALLEGETEAAETAEANETAIVISVDGDAMSIGGDAIESDVKPVGKLLPYRAAAEALGATVSWVRETRTVVTEYNGAAFEFCVDEPIDGVAPQIVDGRVLVPASFITDMLGVVMDIK